MKDNEQIQRRDTWQKIVEEYLASDMTQKFFCEQHNISLPQFVYYHGKFKGEKEQSDEMSSFVPVKMRIPVETNSDSGLQANSESGNIRTPVPAHPNSRNQVTPGLSVKHLQSVKHFGFSSATLPSVQV